MFTQRFSDGTPVPQDYLDSINPLIQGALAATDRYSEDELERFASLQWVIEKNLKGLTPHQIDNLKDLKNSLSADEQYLMAQQFFVDSSGFLVGLIVSSSSLPYQETLYRVRWASRIDQSDPFLEQTVQESRIGRRIGLWYHI